MTQRSLKKRLATGSSGLLARRARHASWLAGLSLLAASVARAEAPRFPILPQQRSTAEQVAQAGVPLSELAPNAPDSHTVKRGDTLWAISGLFLKSPWRWPELWGMNLQQVHNPHLIFPGQVLYLDKRNGRAVLRVGTPLSGGVEGDVKLSPHVRSGELSDAIATVSMNLLEPFFNEAVIFDKSEQLEDAPRIVATQDGALILSRGQTAYVLGELGPVRDWRLFREPKPLTDPATKEVLGFEAQYVGTLSLTREGAEGTGPDGNLVVVPSTFVVSTLRQEAGVGDRLAPVPSREFDNMVPHAPSKEITGLIASIYGGALAAGQSSIVALNRGASDGMERGDVLALWHAGRVIHDSTQPDMPVLKLPDERKGLLFVFRVFDRTSYALIMSADDVIEVGDRFTPP